MKTKEEILNSNCPSMDDLFLDDSGRLFRDRVLNAMQQYSDQQLTQYKVKLKEAFTKADFDDVLILSDYFKIIDTVI